MKYLVFFIIASLNLFSQDIPNTRGTEFYFAFMPNYHNNESTRPPDSLHLYIVTEQATSATLNIWNIYEQQETVILNIPADDVFRYSKHYDDYELATGSNLAGKRRNGVKNSGSPQKVSWHLKTDEKVGAIALNTAELTSDAAMLFPLESLGEEYVVSTYIEDEGSGSNANTLSQFGIIATEDNTEIEIEYSQNISQVSETIFLDKNEIYLSENDNPNYSDQTGTYISSDKKIAVFGSHERAKVPVIGQMQSRDHLFEQMPPVNTWSNEYYVVTFFKEFEGQDDIYRIVPVLDNTQVSANGNALVTLNRGEVFTANIDEPIFLSANNPILVSQIKKSSSTGSQAGRSNSDPFLVIVPPKKNFSTNFTFVSLEAYRPSLLSDTRKYENHYLTIIADNTHSGSVLIDGAIVDLDFLPIANTDHQYAELEVLPGKHNLVSDSKIGLYVYGYGSADSYGYLGGMNFEEFDIYPPELSFIDDCFEVSGSFVDSLSEDGEIESIELAEDENIKLTLDGNNFRIELIDKSIDGKAKVIATDNNGLQTESPLFEINGFTFEIENINSGIDEVFGSVSIEFCKEYEVRNNTDNAKTIENITVSGNPLGIEFSKPLPADLASGESLTFTVCFDAAVAGDFSSQILLDDGCYNEQILEIEQVFRLDQRSPNSQIAVSECPGLFEVFAEETREFDSGIESYEILEETNVEGLELIQDEENLYYQGRVIDRKQDARFSISITDKIDNITILSRSFKGFTLQFGEIELLDKTITSDFGEANCTELNIYNYGKFPINLSNIYFEQNYNFSIPQHALPIIIESGETKSIPVCLLHKRGTEKTDTLVIETDCDKMTLPFEGKVFYNNYSSGSRCDLRVGYINAENAEPFIDNISPNPVIDEFSTYFAVDEDGAYKISIIDSKGVELINETFIAQSGLNRIKLSSRELISGYYQLIISNGDLILQQDFIKRE